jgi:non-homologous end joining protein Ku
MAGLIGKLAVETFRVIGEAMAHRKKVGFGRVTNSSRERPSSRAVPVW